MRRSQVPADSRTSGFRTCRAPDKRCFGSIRAAGQGSQGRVSAERVRARRIARRAVPSAGSRRCDVPAARRVPLLRRGGCRKGAAGGERAGAAGGVGAGPGGALPGAAPGRARCPGASARAGLRGAGGGAGGGACRWSHRPERACRWSCRPRPVRRSRGPPGGGAPARVRVHLRPGRRAGARTGPCSPGHLPPRPALGARGRARDAPGRCFRRCAGDEVAFRPPPFGPARPRPPLPRRAERPPPGRCRRTTGTTGTRPVGGLRPEVGRRLRWHPGPAGRGRPLRPPERPEVALPGDRRPVRGTGHPDGGSEPPCGGSRSVSSRRRGSSSRSHRGCSRSRGSSPRASCGTRGPRTPWRSRSGRCRRAR